MLEYPKKSVVLSLLFLLATVVIIIFILRAILRIGEYRGFSIKIISPTAEGLGIGSPVLVSGVQVGRVSKIELAGDGKKAIITIDIKRNIKIAKDSKVEFKMKGVLGDRVIAFTQGEKIGEHLRDGDVIIIEEDRTELSQIVGSVEDVVQKLSQTLDSITELSEKIGKLVDNLNEFVSDIRSLRIENDLKNSSAGLERTISDARLLIDETKNLVSNIATVVNEISPKLNKFSEDITHISENLKATSESVKEMADIAKKDGILRVIGEEESRKIERIIDDIDNLRTKITNIAEKADNITSELNTELGGKIEGGIHKSRAVFSQQIQARAERKSMFIEIGIVSPPKEDKISLNSLVGFKQSKNLEVGAGFIRSKPSFLTELKPMEHIFIRAEGIGFNPINIRTFLGGSYRSLRIYGGAENLLNSDRFFLIGLEFKN